MSKMSNYLETALGNAVLRNTAYTPPAKVYISLHTADPGETGTNEISAGTYARQEIAFSVPTDGVFPSSAAVDFPVSTSNHGTITHFAIWDDVSAGNLLVYGELTTSRTYNTDQFLRVLAGELSVTFA